MASADDKQLDQSLSEIGMVPDDSVRQQARALYEDLLRVEHPLRTTTFHAFCQEMLRRFPLEAGIVPNFDLIEQTGEQRASAWKRLHEQLLREPDSALARAADELLVTCNGLFNFQVAMHIFLDHRSDWWAYTENQDNPVEQSIQALEQQLQIRLTDNPTERVGNDDLLRQRFSRYAALAGQHSTKTQQTHAQTIVDALENTGNTTATYYQLFSVLFTQKGPPRILKHTKALEKSLGAQQCTELIELQGHLQDQLSEIQEQVNKHHTLRLSAAWYDCGHQLLKHYQDIKTEQGALDFADLEWKTYQLLTNEQHAEWVQYKLDQRINHLLIDEFQDTNPTQWQLLLPLLQEMAAGSAERQRSVFIVGDDKQSIYRFRRADPQLFDTARQWLTENLQADSHKQHKSRRSSPAITDFVNIVFAESASAESTTRPPSGLKNFPHHETHHQGLWGRVELLPLIELEDETSADSETYSSETHWRNPLTTPRTLPSDLRYEQEAGQIIDRIQKLIGQAALDNGQYRPLNYGDIMILVRDRTHIHYYEEALQQAAIPFTGSGKNTFLENLEIRDLIHLLQLLIAPYDNLALASVLRSPIFACTDNDLIELAQQPQQELPNWIDRLQQRAGNNPDNPRLARAATLLKQWQQKVDHIPVHDLLDQIYRDANVINRYISASPDNQKTPVAANLTHFLQMALDVDSGRYPSVSRFVVWLKASAKGEFERPASPVTRTGQRVQVMTIHAAKGMESPIVFLADSARPSRADKGQRALVHWPVNASRPQHFHFIGAKDKRDSVSQEILQQHQQAKEREEHNLLYVALTRAKQHLFISGCAPKKNTKASWYSYIAKRVPESTTTFEHGQARAMETPATAKKTPEPEIDAALCKPLPVVSTPALLNPSQPTQTGKEADENIKASELPEALQPEAISAGKQRGIAIHRMLELMSENNSPENNNPETLERLKQEFNSTLSEKRFKKYLDETNAVLSAPQFAEFFDPGLYQQACNELPILYRNGEQTVYGIIDRLVIKEDEVIIIDYKTHSNATADNSKTLAKEYQQQMQLYTEGVRKLWPDKAIRSVLIFTACQIAE